MRFSKHRLWVRAVIFFRRSWFRAGNLRHWRRSTFGNTPLDRSRTRRFQGSRQDRWWIGGHQRGAAFRLLGHNRLAASSLSDNRQPHILGADRLAVTAHGLINRIGHASLNRFLSSRSFAKISLNHWVTRAAQSALNPILVNWSLTPTTPSCPCHAASPLLRTTSKV